MQGICCTCLSSDEGVKPLRSTGVYAILKSLTVQAGYKKLRTSNKVCWQCMALLNNVRKFQNRAVLNLQRLQKCRNESEIPNEYINNSVSKLSIHKLININIHDDLSDSNDESTGNISEEDDEDDDDDAYVAKALSEYGDFMFNKNNLDVTKDTSSVKCENNNFNAIANEKPVEETAHIEDTLLVQNDICATSETFCVKCENNIFDAVENEKPVEETAHLEDTLPMQVEEYADVIQDRTTNENDESPITNDDTKNNIDISATSETFYVQCEDNVFDPVANEKPVEETAQFEDTLLMQVEEFADVTQDLIKNENDENPVGNDNTEVDEFADVTQDITTNENPISNDDAQNNIDISATSETFYVKCENDIFDTVANEKSVEETAHLEDNFLMQVEEFADVTQDITTNENDESPISNDNNEVQEFAHVTQDMTTNENDESPNSNDDTEHNLDVASDTLSVMCDNNNFDTIVNEKPAEETAHFEDTLRMQVEEFADVTQDITTNKNNDSPISNDDIKVQEVTDITQDITTNENNKSPRNNDDTEIPNECINNSLLKLSIHKLININIHDDLNDSDHESSGNSSEEDDDDAYVAKALSEYGDFMFNKIPNEYINNSVSKLSIHKLININIHDDLSDSSDESTGNISEEDDDDAYVAKALSEYGDFMFNKKNLDTSATSETLSVKCENDSFDAIVNEKPVEEIAQCEDTLLVQHNLDVTSDSLSVKCENDNFDAIVNEKPVEETAHIEDTLLMQEQECADVTEDMTTNENDESLISNNDAEVEEYADVTQDITTNENDESDDNTEAPTRMIVEVEPTWCTQMLTNEKSIWEKSMNHEFLKDSLSKKIDMLPCTSLEVDANMDQELRFIKTPTKESHFICDICNIQCDEKTELVQHIGIHYENNINSDIIGKPFTLDVDEENLNVQIHSDATRKSFDESNICDNKSIRKKYLKINVRTHKRESLESLYKCDSCDYKTVNKNRLISHIRTHKGEKVYKCDSCDYKAVSKNRLIGHIRTHKGEKVYKCDLCNYEAVSKNILIGHIRTHKGVKVYKCDSCDYQTKGKFYIIRHTRKHTGEKPYKCHICDYKSIQRYDLITHIRRHTGENLYKCDSCDYKAVSKNRLITHIRIHTGEKPYKCDSCEYKASNKYNLTRHTLKCTGVPLYKCDACTYKTACEATIKRHIQRHMGERLFKCDFCDYKASRKTTLLHHIRRHTGEKPYECNSCDYRAPSKSALRKHSTRHMVEKPYKCDSCDYRTAQKSSLKRHVCRGYVEAMNKVGNSYQCLLCNYETKNKSNLKVHIRKHTGEKPYKCHLCDYKATDNSNLVRHVRTHTGEKPYKCELCDYKTAHRTALVTHTLRHARKREINCFPVKMEWESPPQGGILMATGQT